MNYVEILRVFDVGANLIVLACCLWAILDDRIRTRLIGTVALSCLAMAAAISIVPPDHITPVYRELQTWRHIALAWLFAWGCLCYRHDIQKQGTPS